MKIWRNRPLEIACYYNPAYLGRIIYSILKSYQSVQPKGLPYDLLFISMPLVLIKPYRDTLPSSTRTYFHSWIQNNEDLKIDFPLVVKDVLPYIKESLIFLAQRNLIRITEEGTFIIGDKKMSSITKNDSNEIKINIKKAEFIGKWIAKISEKESIYILLGVKP